MAEPRSPDTDKRSDERKKAEQMFLDARGNIKNVDIAKALGFPDVKIRKWKQLDNWDAKLRKLPPKTAKKKPSGRTTNSNGDESVPAVPPKRGAPKGNQNAKGGRGNPHPKKPIKHGAYSAVYWDVLDSEEHDIVNNMPQDEETLLLEQIQLFTVRERRIMQAINKYRKSESPVALYMTNREENKRSFDSPEDEEEYNRRIQEKVDREERLPGREYQTSTQTENKDQIITRLESELSNVQAKKTKAIEALAKLHLEKQKIDSDGSDNDVVKSWAAKVLQSRRENHGQ